MIQEKEEVRKDIKVTVRGGTQSIGNTSQESKERALYNIRYSTLLNDAQLDYLSDDGQDINRMKCFKTFLRLAVMEPTKVVEKNYTEELQAGQFIASKVDLGAMWGCNRKTATRIIREFNMMGILESHATNRTTIHTLKCLSVWFTTQGTVKNRFFNINPVVRPMKPSFDVAPEMELKARGGNRVENGLSAGTSCRKTKEKEYGKVIIMHDEADTFTYAETAQTSYLHSRDGNEVNSINDGLPTLVSPITQSSNRPGKANYGQVTSFPNDENRKGLSIPDTCLSKCLQAQTPHNENRTTANTITRYSVP